MNHKLSMLALIAGTLFISTLHAQEKKTIRLDEAIDLGLKNSNKLKLSLAKIEEATAVYKQAMEMKLPSASVTGAYLRVLASNVDLKTKDNNSGGSGGSTTQSPSVNQAAYGLINTALPIYSGGRIRYGIQSSEYLAQAAKLDAEGDRDEVIQNTIEAFSNLFKANSAVRLVKENLSQSQQRAKDLSNLEQNGLLARNDLLKAELQTSSVELNLLDAENNLQLANVNMDLQLGLPVTTELVLDTAGIERKDDNRVLEDYYQTAVSHRRDVEAIGNRKKAAMTDVKTINAARYPSLSLTAGYIAADIPHLITITNTVNVGLGVSYDIASLWKNKSKVDQAEARVKEWTASEAMMNDSVRLQVNRSYFALVSSRKKVQVYAQALEQANENYRIVKNKFDNSLATTTDLLDADVAQLQSNLSYTLARADAFVAYHRLLKSAGILSEELIKNK